MSAALDANPIGPGRLVLVVGPSGAGKDTLIRAARAALASDPRYVFPRRIVTRPASATEDNRCCDPDTFARIDAEGGFAVSWAAHGLSYGLPASIVLAVAEGRTVICNTSRTVVTDLRVRYANVVVIEVTASPQILARRLASRGRSEDGSVQDRIARTREICEVRPDMTIANETSVDDVLPGFLAAFGAPAMPERSA